MQTNCYFPTAASEEERQFTWECLGVLQENELPLPPSQTSEQKLPRFDVRVIIKNSENKVCLVVSGKYHFASIVGGSIEEGETIEQALRREAHEEAGYALKNIQPLGYFQEMRHPAMKNVFVFMANTDENIGINYMDDELEAEFYTSWVSLDDAVQELQTEDARLAAVSEKSYNGTFATRRDLTLLRHYRDNCQKD